MFHAGIQNKIETDKWVKSGDREKLKQNMKEQRQIDEASLHSNFFVRKYRGEMGNRILAHEVASLNPAHDLHSYNAIYLPLQNTPSSPDFVEKPSWEETVLLKSVGKTDLGKKRLWGKRFCEKIGLGKTMLGRIGSGKTVWRKIDLGKTCLGKYGFGDTSLGKILFWENQFVENSGLENLMLVEIGFENRFGEKRVCKKRVWGKRFWESVFSKNRCCNKNDLGAPIWEKRPGKKRFAKKLFGENRFCNIAVFRGTRLRKTILDKMILGKTIWGKRSWENRANLTIKGVTEEQVQKGNPKGNPDRSSEGQPLGNSQENSEKRDDRSNEVAKSKRGRPRLAWPSFLKLAGQ